jgi:hypothetical protein
VSPHTLDRPLRKPRFPPPGFLPFQRRSPVPTISVSRLPQREQTSRFPQSETGVSGPYRRAISAGSALVPPSAAGSDAVAGSTWWRPLLALGEAVWLREREAPHDQANLGSRGIPEGHRRGGLRFAASSPLRPNGIGFVSRGTYRNYFLHTRRRRGVVNLGMDRVPVNLRAGKVYCQSLLQQLQFHL